MLILPAKVSIFFKLPKKMTENFQKIIKNILSDIRVEMTEEFDQNFERQAFFSEAWQRRKSPFRNDHITHFYYYEAELHGRTV